MVYNSHGGPDLSCSADWHGTKHKKVSGPVGGPSAGSSINGRQLADLRRIAMKVWTKPAVREQEVGLEVTSYLPAEIDII